MEMKTYNFKVVVEPDEDFDGNPSGYHAYCPALEQQGASTWGTTEAEALKNIDSLIRMVVQSMIEHGERLPEEPSDQVEVTVQRFAAEEHGPDLMDGSRSPGLY
jgi:predicted RNase H-like HicB family nuclease